MRTATIGLIALSALAIGACHPKPLKHHNETFSLDASDSDKDDDSDTGRAPLKALAALTCPDSEGDLTRTAQAPDGRSCDYRGPDDETVHLSLVALDGRTPIDAMAPMKAELDGLVHVAVSGGPVSVEASKGGDGGDHAKVDLPFIHVDANDNKAKVKIFGINIDADGDRATVHGGPGMKHTVVHAGPGGAQIVAEDVGKTNASLVYILAGDSPGPSGYRAVGYVARGPSAGPLVVGEFKSRSNNHHHDDDHDDVSRLVDLNVKG